MAARLLVEGGVPLRGEVAASAAKNAALPALAAALLTARPRDARRTSPSSATCAPREAAADARRRRAPPTPRRPRVDRRARGQRPGALRAGLDHARLRARAGPAARPRPARPRVALPGGCAIGVRPIDQHLKGLQSWAPRSHRATATWRRGRSRLKGARITTDLVTVTGTENLMMAAALAEGTTVIENAAREPEVADLARAAHRDGRAHRRARAPSASRSRACPSWAGRATAIIPDRIEAGTLLVAGAITGGDVTVTDVGAAPRGRGARQARGVRRRGDVIGTACAAGPGAGRPRPTDIVTSPFPGFPTDMQAQFMALLGLADGSVEDHRDDLREPLHARGRAGAAWARGSTPRARPPIVRGVRGLPGRAGDGHRPARLRRRSCWPAWRRRGRTEVSRVYHLDRGYERLETKLAHARRRASSD